ncbi:MAG: ATP-grasp domain-containing protein [Alphaproteobacteria bacterium]
MLLIPTTSYRVADFMAAAERLGVEVVVGSNRRQVLENLAEGGTVRIDFRDLDKGVAEIAAYAKPHPLAAIVGVDDETTLLAARAAAALGLPHNDPDAVAASRNKHRFRYIVAQAGLASPEFRLVTLADDPVEAARAAPYPCVLKPLALAGSRGVIRADDPTAFVAAFRRIAAILARPDAALPGATARQILVESYVPGDEVALEGLLEDGHLRVLALFDKPDPLEGPYFEETIYLTPSRLPAAAQAAVAEATKRAAAALGLSEGPVHAELRLNERGAWVIEVAARSIGGLCSRVLRFGAGMSLEELVLRHALGLPAGSRERERRPAGVMMIPIPAAGVLHQVHGLDAARRVPGVEDVTITIPCGQPVVPLPEGDRYLGFIFARAATTAAVEKALRAAHGRLEFAIAPAAET